MVKINTIFFIALLCICSSAMGSFEASSSDIKGLDKFIASYKMAIKEKDIPWMVKNDPRYLTLAEWSKKDQSEMIDDLVENYPEDIFSYDLGESKVVCSLNINNLVLSLVDNNIVFEGSLINFLTIYIKNEGRWWYTGNTDARVGLYPFRKKMLGNIDNPVDLKEHQRALSSNECMSRVKF